MDDWEPPIDRPSAPPKSNTGLIIAVVAGALLLVGGGAYWLLTGPAPGPAAVPDAGVVEVAGDAAAPPTLPSADGDALLRKIAAELSPNAELARWLAVPDILRRVAAAVRLVAQGRSPKPMIPFIEVQGEFTVHDALAKRPRPRRTGPAAVTERLLITPESYARYDAITQVLTAVDPAAAGRAYAQLRPYFDSAFAEVAAPGERFDQLLAQALGRISRVPITDAPIEVVEKGALYAYKDPALESLSDAEKHVLRMGPKNARALQDAARRFAEAAGLPL